MKKRFGILLAAVLLLSGCAEPEAAAEGICLYYINAAGDELEHESFSAAGKSAQEIADQLVEALSDEARLPEEAQSVLQNGIRIASCETDGDLIRIDLSGDYGSLVHSYKLLLTAGLTKTFEQIEGINRVRITIQGEPLLDSKGKELGTLTAEDFVIHSGKEINAYSSTKMTLYFLNAGGMVVPETRTVYYGSSVPMEQVVLDELIKGPIEQEHLPSLPVDLNYINVTTQEEICYVNFDENMFTVIQGYDIRKMLDAIVKSLSSVCDVKKVQFSINGDTAIVIDGLSLDQIFEA